MRNYSRLTLPLVLVLVVLLGFPSGFFDPWLAVGLAVISGAWFFLYPRWLDRRVLRRSVRMLQEGNNDSVFGQRAIELLPEKVHIISSAGETIYHGSAITRIVETPEALLLYVSALQALVLPKSKLSDADFQEAVLYARAHYAK